MLNNILKTRVARPEKRTTAIQIFVAINAARREQESKDEIRKVSLTIHKNFCSGIEKTTRRYYSL
jgi:hypothetical protein